MNPLRFIELAAILWWGFVAVAGLFAVVVIALNMATDARIRHDVRTNADEDM